MESTILYDEMSTNICFDVMVFAPVAALQIRASAFVLTVRVVPASQEIKQTERR